MIKNSDKINSNLFKVINCNDWLQQTSLYIQCVYCVGCIKCTSVK